MNSRVFFLFIVSSLAYLSNLYGTELEHFPLSTTFVARHIVSDYFDGKHVLFSNKNSRLSGIQLVNLAGIHLALDIITEKQKEPAPTARTKDRIQKLLLFIERLAEVSAKEDNVKLRFAINRQLDHLLQIFRVQSVNQDTVIRIMDALDLWSGENLWFFKQYIRYPGKLSFHFDRISRLIPKLNSDELSQLASALQEHRPYHISQLNLLMQLGLLTDDERAALFRITAANFDPREFSQLEKDIQDNNLENIVGANKSNRIYLLTIQRMAALLNAGDSDYLHSYKKTKEDFERQPPSLERNVRLIFLKLLMNKDVDWSLAANWGHEINGKSAPRYQKEGNVLIVHFGDQKNCVQTLQ